MFNDFMNTASYIAGFDKEVADAMNLELKRQRDNIELIASENIVSQTSMQRATQQRDITAAASVLILLKTSQTREQRSSSVQNIQTFSPIQALRQTLQPTLHFSTTVTQSSV